MRKSFSPLQNRHGQFVIEAVLLVTLSIGLFMAGTKYLREKKVIEKAVQGPGSRVATMTEAGIWAENTPEQLKRHANTAHNRGVTLLDFQ